MNNNELSNQGAPAGGDGPPLPSALFSLQIIWVALLLSVGMYVGMAFLVIARGSGAPDSPIPIATLEPALALMSLACLGAAYFVPPMLFRTALGKQDVAALDLPKLVAISFTPWVVRLAMSETVAIFGLVLAMLSQRPMKIVPFAVLAVLAMLAWFPSERALRQTDTRA